MITKILPTVFTKGKAVLNSAEKISKNANKTNSVLKSLTGTIEDSEKIKENLIENYASKKVKKFVGQDVSVSNAVEKNMQELVDSKFRGSQSIVKRIKNVFVPVSFPSGEHFNLKKSQLNEVKSKLEKDKQVFLEFNDKTGASLKALFTQKQQCLGEDCSKVSIIRTLASGEQEKVRVAYFPKSSEIRVISEDVNGSKTFYSIFGQDEGAKIKPNKAAVAEDSFVKNN